MKSNKSLVIIASIVVVVVLLTGSCSAGFIAGRTLGAPASPWALGLGAENPLESMPVVGVNSSQGGTPEDLQNLFTPFWQTWELVKKDYVEQPVDEELMMRGAIRGMLDTLGDEHTSYLDPEMYERASAQLDGQEYEGIGAWVDISGDFLTIISPMPGSPAEKAGLRSGDKVIAVDGEDMTGWDGEAVRQRVIGPKGSTVKLTIAREGSEPFDVEIERAAIVVPTLESKMLDNQVAYVHLYTFGINTGSDLRKALKDLMDQKPVGLVLDLRNNGGGYLDTAIEVASQFIGDGVIMYEEFGDGRTTTYEAESGGLATKIPIVVLVNEGSASASEIVAGAIRDRGRGQLVGVKSFGKGSVQTYMVLDNNEGAVRVTVAHWLTPNKTQINGVGLEPDYVVEFTEEDINAQRDVQLDKAVEVLLSQQ
ncbi:MAG: S41 family peptidase [Chloroflexota bacterium]